MFHDFCQSVTLVFCQRTHVSHDHHPRGPCCSRARLSYDEPYMGAISYQKIFASALIGNANANGQYYRPITPVHMLAAGPPFRAEPLLSQSGERRDMMRQNVMGWILSQNQRSL